MKTTSAYNTKCKLDEESYANWSLNNEFEAFAERECAWWDRHGAPRPKEHLVRPSGPPNDPLSAPVACHLYNPTFSVENPCIQETQDLSNPSIAQLHEAGFSTENHCLLFDHFARRDESRYCADVYSEDLAKVHEDFVSQLRFAMKAVVEICWGARVRACMMKNLGINLEPLPLWGCYAGLTLYLELIGNSLKRFVIFVAHPQRFMYVQSNGERAQSWRRRFGIEQDRVLQLGAQLGGIRIQPNFYESDPRLIANLRLTRKVRFQRNVWKSQALAQLKTAFPGAEFTSYKSSHDNLHYVHSTDEDESAAQQAFQLVENLQARKISETARLSTNDEDTALVGNISVQW